MSLQAYQDKRDFRRTPEPKGKARKTFRRQRYVVQKHAASRLHYDFRLEHDGVLLSWAIPKGPALDPDEKRLAVRVEDHPVAYGDFEGTIPADQYGGGTVMLWDRGEWKPRDDPDKALSKGKLKFTLDGEKLKGGWSLVRMRHRKDDRDNWLLIKEDDEDARSIDEYDVLEAQPFSVASGASMEEIGNDDGQVWDSTRGKQSPSTRVGRRDDAGPALPDPGGLPQARKGAFPKTISPQLATLVDKVPEGDRWLHEIKFDGYRLIAMVKDGKARLLTRNGKDWTRKFPAVREAVSNLPVDAAVLDGEVIVQNPDGTQDFQALQNVMKGSRKADLMYYLFDVMHCNGIDLSRTPLARRKSFLRSLLLAAPADRVLQYSDHIDAPSKDVYEQACRLGMEGVISKRADCPYEQKRSRAWLKTKCLSRQEFVIGGYSEPSGSRRGFGALLLGHHADDELIYAGRVGAGFDEETLMRIQARLKKLRRQTPPFTNSPTGREARGVHWVTPKLVAEVRFAEWTSDGVLRQPVFEGIREDRSPENVTREQPTSSAAEEKGGDGRSRVSNPRQSGRSGSTRLHGVRLTNPDKVLYDKQKLTKRDLVRFYERIADHVLPHVTDRPLSILRCPDGRSGECFYQKHVTDSLPDAIHAVRIREKSSEKQYIFIKDLAGLLSLVQLGALEVHPWGSRVDDPDKPDRLVFDLDPGSNVPWSAVVEGARLVHEHLEEMGLEAFLKTSGGKGLHVVVPLIRRSDWDETKAFAKGVADMIVKEQPTRYVATMSRAKRKGKVFIDYLRNSRGATSVAAYSTRARNGATVSTPLRWDELSESLDSAAYGVRNLPQRLASLKKEPWSTFFSIRQSITSNMKERVGL